MKGAHWEYHSSTALAFLLKPNIKGSLLQISTPQRGESRPGLQTWKHLKKTFSSRGLRIEQFVKLWEEHSWNIEWNFHFHHQNLGKSAHPKFHYQKNQINHAIYMPMPCPFAIFFAHHLRISSSPEDGAFLTEVFGSPEYWAPEVAACEYTLAADVWVGSLKPQLISSIPQLNSNWLNSFGPSLDLLDFLFWVLKENCNNYSGFHIEIWDFSVPLIHWSESLRWPHDSWNLRHPWKVSQLRLLELYCGLRRQSDLARHRIVGWHIDLEVLGINTSENLRSTTEPLAKSLGSCPSPAFTTSWPKRLCTEFSFAEHGEAGTCILSTVCVWLYMYIMYIYVYVILVLHNHCITLFDYAYIELIL